MWTTETLWVSFNQRMRVYISKRVDDQEDVEDLLQDLFIKIHTNLHTVRDQGQILIWLYQTARNLVIDYYRSKRTTLPLPESLVSEDSPIELDAFQELASGLGEMIDCLPEIYRVALVEVELNAIPQSKLAVELNLSVSGAKSRVQRGRTMLRKILWDCCHFELDKQNRVKEYFPRNPCCQNCKLDARQATNLS